MKFSSKEKNKTSHLMLPIHSTDTQWHSAYKSSRTCKLNLSSILCELRQSMKWGIGIHEFACLSPFSFEISFKTYFFCILRLIL